ncbi:MAG TPA: hypothetical protein VFB21_04955 [Chthonomonadaceae bacterium]|nr:hypothetical protein [Chthonomonadaceae bacterium]
MAVSRRNFVQGVVAATTLAGTGESMARAAEKEPPSPVALVNRGELSVLFGDSTTHGMGRTGYCGIWSLTSAQQPHNAFISSYAGFIYNSQRGRPVELRRLAEDQVEFVLNDPGSHTRALFTVREPYYVDCEATVTLQNRVSGPYLLQSWASYINSPEDGDIYFRHAGNWVRAHSPQHGVEATYAPASLKDIEDDLRHLTPEERKNNFVYGYSQQRFTEPFYYGRIRNMALAFFFDTADAIRFAISPSGGGTSILPGKSCPAWDWLWLIRDAQPGKPFTLRMRMVYKAFVSPEDILDEFTRWRK